MISLLLLFTVAVSQGSGSPLRDVPVYDVKVDRVQDCRHHVETASLSLFTLSEPAAKVRIVSSAPVREVRVRPSSAGLVPSVTGDTICFEVSRPGTFSVEVNGDIYHNLHLVVNRQYPKPSGKAVVFGAGYHKLPGGYLDVHSGQEVYLAEGAWVEGGIRVRGAENVHIYGPGVIRPAGRGYGVEISGSRNVVVEGITTTQVPCGGSRDVVIRGVKCFTHYGWGDGLNIFASENVTQQGCFLRTSDDCITVYATRMGYVGGSANINVSDMTLWADVAHPIFIGLHGAASYISDNESRGLPLRPDAASIVSRCDTIRGVSFRNIDILEHNERQVDYQGCMAIVAGDNNVVSDVVFEDVRVDSIRHGSLLTLRIFQNRKYCKAPGRSISHVTFRNVSSCGGGELSVIEGYDSLRTVSDVVFENLRIGGVHVCDTMPGKPKWYKTSDMCRFLVGSYVDGVAFR